MKTYLYACVGEFPKSTNLEHFIHFVRTTEGTVPLPATFEEACEILPSYFEIGVLTGHSLSMLEQLLTQVWYTWCLRQSTVGN